MVDTAPVFATGDQAEFALGEPGSFAISTTGVPAPAISAVDPLPPGLTLTDNGTGMATLAGTPTRPGSFPVTLRASNADGTAESVLTVEVR